MANVSENPPNSDSDSHVWCEGWKLRDRTSLVSVFPLLK